MEKELILAMKEEAELEMQKLNDEIAKAKLDIIYYEARRDFAEELISRLDENAGEAVEQPTDDEQVLYATEEQEV